VTGSNFYPRLGVYLLRAAATALNLFERGIKVNVIARDVDVLTPEAARLAYARLARCYDLLFGPLLSPARTTAIRAINALPGRDVLEVGVGTGLALPKYAAEKRVTGIDVSSDMLAKARERTARRGLSNVQSLYEMDAQATNFGDGQFDVAVAMFVASVVPDPGALLMEMRRIVKPGGTLLFVNHFARQGGPAWWREISGALSAKLGWRAEFRLEDIFSPSDLAGASRIALKPLGFFQLVELRQPVNGKSLPPF
jgi:phosphatidylethanolamine/phosphatidyl-N-methylethanolamine N-methyltransferase